MNASEVPDQLARIGAEALAPLAHEPYDREGARKRKACKQDWHWSPHSGHCPDCGDGWTTSDDLERERAKRIREQADNTARRVLAAVLPLTEDTA